MNKKESAQKQRTKKELLDELTALRQELENVQSTQAEMKKDKEAQEEKGKFLTHIFSSIPEGINVLDPEMNILFVNPTMERWTPHVRPLVGRKCYEAYHGRSQRCEVCPCYETFQTGQVANEIIPVLDTKGEISGWSHHFSFPMLDLETGRISSVIEYIRNITKGKQAEDALKASEERYRSILENLADGYYETDLAGHFTFFNDQLTKIFSYTRDELMGMDNRQYADAENAKKIYQAFNRVYRTGEPAIGSPFETITKNKTRRNVELSISLIRDASGKPVGFRGIARDITDLIKIQSDLRESEERYRTIIETMEDGYYEVDLAGNFTYVNEAMAQLTGYSAKELLGIRTSTHTMQYTDAENAKILSQAFTQIYRTGEPSKGIIYRASHKNGEWKTISTSATLIRDEQGNPKGFRGISRDITDLILIQNALRESEERYRTIIETIEDAYYEMDLTGNFTFFNAAMFRIMEYPMDEMLGLNYRQFTDAENAQLLFEAFNQVYLTGEPCKSLQFNAFNKNGVMKSIITSVSLIRDGSGEPVGFRGISKDITELIQIQTDLRASEERYRTIIETIEDGYYEVDLAGKVTFLNDALARINGYPKEKMIGMHAREYTDAENTELLDREFTQIYRTGKPSKGILYEVITQNGERRRLETSVSLIRDFSGHPLGFRGISRDITPLIQIQEDLRKSEERYRTIIETIEDGYFEVDLAGNLTYFNDTLVRIHEYPRAEMERMNNRHYTDAENAKILYRAFNKVYRTGEPSKGTHYEIITKGGGRKNLESSVSLIRDSNGNPVGFRGIVRDVTELRQAQRALQSSEERFRIAAESTNDFIYEWDLQSGQIDWSGMSGAKLGHILGELPLTAGEYEKRIHPEDQERFSKAVINHLRQGDPYQEEYRMIGKEGNIIHLSVAGTGLRDGKGRVNKWIGVITDITERKNAEQALLRSEERFRIAAESTNDFIFEWDLKSGRLEWFGNVVERLGHLLGEIPKDISTWNKLTHPEDLERLSEAVRRHLRLREPYMEEYRMIGKTGDIIHVRGAGMCLRDETGRGYKWVGALSDITQQKKTEEELKQSFEKVRKAMGGIIQAMALTVESKDPYTAGHQQRVSNLARTIAQEMGLSKDQVEAVRLAGVVHDLGKISVPAEILSKPTKLSDLEFSLIQGHSQTSYEILKDIDFPWPIARIALQHHERLNGSGYPAGLKGDEILIEAQVLMVADVVEAIASHRPYRAARGIDLALEEIEKNKGVLYNPTVVEACLKLFREKDFSLDRSLLTAVGP